MKNKDKDYHESIYKERIEKLEVESFILLLSIKCGQVVINSVDNAEWFVDIY